jgi:hypothetical protein
MDDSKMSSDVIKRFNAIISLLLDLVGNAENVSTTAKVRKLIDIGLTPANVADILGKPINYITAILNQSNKRKGGKNARATK